MFTGFFHIFSGAVLAPVALMLGMSGAVAVYLAPAPGEALEPVGAAARHVTVEQDTTSVSFEALHRTVDRVSVQGWPTQVGGDELGGAMVVVAIGSSTGSVEFGEMPRLVEFSLSGGAQPASK